MLDELAWLVDSLMVVDSLLGVIEGENEMKALIQSKFTLTDRAQALHANYDSLYAIYQEQVLSALQDAYNANEAIGVAEQFEVNEKTVNRIYLLSILEQGRALTESQVSELKPIAQQCPEEGGLAVYAALNLLPDCEKAGLEICEPEFIDDAEPLSSHAPEEGKGIKAGAESRVLLYPNPAGSSFFVGLPPQSTGKVIVAGLDGKTVYARPANEVGVSVEIRHTLPPGIYFVKVLMNDGSVLTKKLIIHTR